jgi:calcineurin-like phosphoesterase family protein
VEHRPVDEGHVILHGHVHGTWRAQGRQLNVGVDVWDYRPVADATLAPLVLAALRPA